MGDGADFRGLRGGGDVGGNRGNPHLLSLGADSSLNMEGKESRFGILASSLFAVVTTCGLLRCGQRDA